MTAPPFDVLRIDHLVLRVADLDRSLRFYQEVLGCRLERRRDELGLVHLRAGSSMIDLVTLDGPLGRKLGAGPGDEGRNLDHCCLRVDQLDEGAIRAHLAQFGIAPPAAAEPRFGAEGVGPSLYLQDPDGNTVELKGAPTPAA